MKANELRKNNLVYLVVDGVKRRVAIQFNDLIDFDAGITDYQPIPLTEQVLLDFGFNIIKGTEHNKDAIFTEFADFRLYLSENDRLVQNSIHFMADEGWHPCLIKFDFVHEFQNAYKVLTGSELTNKQI